MKEFFDAIQAGDADLVKTMLEKDPSLKNARSSSGAMAVQEAVYASQRPIADILVNAGADLDIFAACCVGNAAVVAKYVTKKNVDDLSQDGFTALCLAAAFGGADCVRALFVAYADPYVRSTALGGIAPIHAAVFGQNSECIRQVLESGADPDMTQTGGFTPLMGAAQNGNLEAVKLLLEHGADKTIKNDAGKTAWDLASEAGHEGLRPLLS